MRRIDDLGLNNLKLIQDSDFFCFGVDAVLLSDFSKDLKDNSTVLDIGTGNAILPILLSAKSKAKKIYGLEIQEKLFNLANENIELNNLNKKVKIVHEDICNIQNIFNKSSFNVIVTNPPYKRKDSGLINTNEHIYIAKNEVKCTLKDIIEKANYLLEPGGEFYMVHRPDRLVDILSLMRSQHVEPKLLRFVHSKPNTAPILILVKGIKDAKPFLKIDRPLYIYDNCRKYTDEIFDIYGKDVKYE